MNHQVSLAAAERAGFTPASGLSTGPVPLEPYRSAEFYALERDRVFRRAWLMLARIEELPAPGDYVVKQIYPCDLSVLIVRGADGTVRAFHNSCSHRGSEVVGSAKGRSSRFVCPYHKWTYANDGRLLGIPDEASFFAVDKSSCGLAPIACDVWEGWVFVNLQRRPEVSLPVFLGSFAEHFKGVSYQAVGTPFILTAELDANWKVVSDAFIESYHIPAIHPKTIATTFSSGANPFGRLLDARLLGPHRAVSMYGNSGYTSDPAARVEQLAFSAAAAGSVIAAATMDNAAGFLDHPAINPTGSADWSMDVNHLFPHTQIDCGPGGFWTHQFWPVAPNRCHYEGRFYVPPARNVRERFQQELYFSRVIEVVLEDLTNVARTQRGIDGGGKDFMQLQDNEIGIRHSVEQVLKWVAAETVAEALA